MIDGVRYFQQQAWSGLGIEKFSNQACAITALINELSEEYTTQTGEKLPRITGAMMLLATVYNGAVSRKGANVDDWTGAANAAWSYTGIAGSWKKVDALETSFNGGHEIYMIRTSGRLGTHSVNPIGTNRYFDPDSGTIGMIDMSRLDRQRPTRDLIFKR